MTAVIQRVNKATVYADGILSGSIEKGLYILVGIGSGDTELDARALAAKIAKLRIFSDENGKMNLSCVDINADALVVSNFTLMANYAKGNRPDYLDSASPCVAMPLYEHFIECLKQYINKVESGVFGSDMRTEMSTDGPVTIVMNSKILLKKP